MPGRTPREHRCPADDTPCPRCDARAEARADLIAEAADWTDHDLDVMADYAAARDYGGGRP